MSAVGDMIGSLTGENVADAYSQGYENQAALTQKGIEQMRMLFGKTSRQFSPFIQKGTDAYRQMSALSGARGAEAQARAYSRFQQSPGQQFLQQQAEKALLRNAAVTGNLGGGRTQQALQQQAIGLASQDFENYYSRLGGIANMGLGLLQQKEQYRQGLGQGIAGLQSGLGQSSMQSLVGGAQAQQQGLQDILGTGAMLYALSDRKLKTEINELGEIKGVKFYSWKWNEKANKLGLFGNDFGVIAQEIQKSHPDAVIDGEYLRVDCRKVADILEAA